MTIIAGEVELIDLSKKAEIKMKAVESSFIASIGYSEEYNILRIFFKPSESSDSVSANDYYNISPSIFADFITADSKGKYFNKYIKGKYKSSFLGQYVPWFKGGSQFCDSAISF